MTLGPALRQNISSNLKIKNEGNAILLPLSLTSAKFELLDVVKDINKFIKTTLERSIYVKPHPADDTKGILKLCNGKNYLMDGSGNQEIYMMSLKIVLSV